jgi:hypothetical protein
MGFRPQGIVSFIAVSLLAGCANFGSMTTSALSATDRMLAYALDKMFAPELRPMEVGYRGFFKDVSEEIQRKCKNLDCTSINVGWASDEAKANFVTKCEREDNGYLGCEHFKQVWGDVKIYPAGSSAFGIVAGKYEMVAFESRGIHGAELAQRQVKYHPSITGLVKTPVPTQAPSVFRPPEESPSVAKIAVEPPEQPAKVSVNPVVHAPVTKTDPAIQPKAFPVSAPVITKAISKPVSIQKPDSAYRKAALPTKKEIPTKQKPKAKQSKSKKAGSKKSQSKVRERVRTI